MDDAVIAAQHAVYDLTNTFMPNLVQTDAEIPDYWNDDRYQPTYTWAKANEPRYGNESAWYESAPHGYKEANIMDNSVIADQTTRYDLTRVVAPYLVQTEENVKIPDYWNDERYDPTWTWAKANEPRYGNESAWMESSPAGYKENDIFGPSVIASQEA